MIIYVFIEHIYAIYCVIAEKISETVLNRWNHLEQEFI